MKPEISGLLNAAAAKYGIDPDLLSRVAMTESGGDQAARSPVGAMGVMQLMPGTARDLGVDPSDVAQNIDGGARYFGQQLKRFGTPELAAAAYNAGPGRVARAGGVPNIRETQNYVAKVTGMNGGGGQAKMAGGSGADIFGMDAPAAGGPQAGSGADIFADAPAATAPVAQPAAPKGPPKMAPKLNVAADVAKSGGAGVMQGFSAIPGFGGDVANLWGNGVDWVAHHAIGGLQDVTGKNLGAPYMGSRRDATAAPPPPTTDYAKMSGLPSSADVNAARQKLTGKDYQPQTLPGQYARTVGQFAPAALAPGSIANRAANVAMPALASETAGQATKGTKWEAPARVVGGMAGGLLAPRAALTAEGLPGLPARMAARSALNPTPVQVLKNAGVKGLTPGQQAGGLVKNVEDLAMRAPILGPAISGARQRANVSLNRAVANEALQPLGEVVPPHVSAGHEAVDYVASRLGREYDDAAAMVPSVAPDAAFHTALADVSSGINELPTNIQEQYRNILKNRLDAHLTGPVTGTQLRKIQESIGQKAAKYAGSMDVDQQDLGHMLEGVSGALKDLLGRANPAAGAKITAANKGWTSYVRLRNAAAKSNTDGIFTPGQLSVAVRSMDKSVGKGNVAKGRATGQDLSKAASAVMPDQFGNPGTANALGMGGLIVGAPLNPVGTAGAVAGLGGASIPYMMMGRNLSKAAPKLPTSAADIAKMQALLAAHEARHLTASAAPSLRGAVVGGLLAR